MEANSERQFVKIIKEICIECKIKLMLISYDWIVILNRGAITRYIMGYNFDINPAVSQMIANDKSATCDILKLNEVSVVEHHLFLSPKNLNYVGLQGNWNNILDIGNKYNFNLVCKSNSGTGGNDVFRVKNQGELELAVHELFTRNRSISVCPFYKIKNEFRTIVLNSKALLTYKKNRPGVVGNNNKNIIQLICEQLDPKQAINVISEDILPNALVDFTEILDDGVRKELAWKHNLGKGAKPEIIPDSELLVSLQKLATGAADAIQLRFCSVDIIETEESEFLVLEVNSGIMMEAFAEFADDGYSIAKMVYTKAIESMFETT